MNKPQELKVIQTIIPQLIQITDNDFKSASLKKEQKADQSMLTVTDLKLNNLLQTTIKKHFPNDAILSEEGEQNNQYQSGRMWILDPICGTYNFAVGIPLFTTNITVVENNKPLFSLVVDYPKQTYYWTSAELQGVYEEDVRVKKPLDLTGNGIVLIDTGYLMVPNGSKQNQNAFANIIKDILMDQHEITCLYTSLAFAYAALGKYAAFLITTTTPWDISASSHLMDKNGGIATDFNGDPWKPQSTEIIASLDKKLHHKLLKIIQTHWPKK